MENRIIKRLDKTNSVDSTNKTFGVNLLFENTHKLFVDNDITHMINESDLYNKERNSTTKYRIVATISTLFHNTLHNVKRDTGLYIFQSDSFRDKSDYGLNWLTFGESIDENLQNKNGWYGYYSDGKWNDLTPKRSDLELINETKTNWEILITYPYSKDDTHFLVNGGLKVVDCKIIDVGGINMLALFTPIKHGLVSGDYVNVYNLGKYATSAGNKFRVKLVGLPDNTLKDHAFILDVNIGTDLVPNSIATRFKKVIDGVESTYYFRIFRRLTEITDYDVFPLNLSNTVYGDKQYQVVFNGGKNDLPEIDIATFINGATVENIVDNLGRPVTELFLTCVKKYEQQIFTPVLSGVYMQYFDSVQSDLQSAKDFLGLSDICRIHEDTILSTKKYPDSHIPLNEGVYEGSTEYYGDVVEYNKKYLIETVLGDVHHRFNILERLNSFPMDVNLDSDTADNILNTTTINTGIRPEGYYYKPHHNIKLRNWSQYIEYGTTGKTEVMVGDEKIMIEGETGIPSYAEYIDGSYAWRDLLDIGYKGEVESDLVDYPFINGCHYIHTNCLLTLRRQDPYGKYGLYYSQFPKDPYGDKFFDDNYIYKNNQDVC